jgi:hypothetical protein
MSDYTGGDNGYTPLMGASRTPYDVSNTPRHEVLNYEGTPTQFSDDSGLKALLTRQGIFDINSFNPILSMQLTQNLLIFQISLFEFSNNYKRPSS